MSEVDNVAKKQNEKDQTECLSLKQKIKQYFKTLPKRYFITAFSGMAQGLFVTLIAGTILATIAKELIGLGNYFWYFRICNKEN